MELKIRFGDLTMYVGTYPDKTIIEIKEEIEQETSIKPESYYLSYQNKAMEDTKRLIDYHISERTELQFCPRMLGSGKLATQKKLKRNKKNKKHLSDDDEEDTVDYEPEGEYMDVDEDDGDLMVTSPRTTRSLAELENSFCTVIKNIVGVIKPLSEYDFKEFKDKCEAYMSMVRLRNNTGLASIMMDANITDLKDLQRELPKSVLSRQRRVVVLQLCRFLFANWHDKLMKNQTLLRNARDTLYTLVDTAWVETCGSGQGCNKSLINEINKAIAQKTEYEAKIKAEAAAIAAREELEQMRAQIAVLQAQALQAQPPQPPQPPVPQGLLSRLLDAGRGSSI